MTRNAPSAAKAAFADHYRITNCGEQAYCAKEEHHPRRNTVPHVTRKIPHNGAAPVHQYCHGERENHESDVEIAPSPGKFLHRRGCGEDEVDNENSADEALSFVDVNQGCEETNYDHRHRKHDSTLPVHAAAFGDSQSDGSSDECDETGAEMRDNGEPDGTSRRRNRNFIHGHLGERTSLKKPYERGNLLFQAALLCVALACAGGPKTSQELARGEVAVIAARILDPATADYSGPSAIIIRGTRIVDVIPRAQFNRSQVDSVIDLSSMTVVPGLIDAHVHLGIGGPYAANAKADLAAGFTTVADLGSRTNRMLRIRDSINAGSIPGPRVLATGTWIGTKGGVCEFNGLGIAGGAELFRQRVVENATAGADLIKVCVSGWPAASFAQPDKYEIADDALEAVVKEAHARGKKVVAHDISAGGIRAGIKYGIDGLAHTGYLDDALAAELARHNIYLITTLASLTSGDTSAVGRGLVRSVGVASKANVMLVMGTDGGVLPHGRNAEELVALTRAGLTPGDAIRAATINAAKALGIQDSVGRIVKGMSADLIAVDGDPLRDVSVLTGVKHVMLRGHFIR